MAKILGAIVAVVVALTALARLSSSAPRVPPHVEPDAASPIEDAATPPPAPTEFIVGEPSVPDVGPDVQSLPTVSPRDDEPSEINPRQDPRQR